MKPNRGALGFASLALLVACAPPYKSRRHHVVFQVAPAPTPHQAPPSRFEADDYWDEALHSIALPIARAGSPATYLGFAVGGPAAEDVNAFGQVPDSLWFENRIARGLTSSEAIANGPAAERGPAEGELTIISGKLQGVAPGFVVRDARSVVFFVKFDPPAFPSIASGAEMVATRLLDAAGYHVPENFLVDLDLGRLRLDPAARTRDHYNRSVALTQDGLDFLLAQLNPDPSKRTRALFSRSVPGTPIGPFRYRGVRAEDPNDTIAHERRRSLRGLWLFAAWLGNVDVRGHNTMDTFIETSDRLGVIKHYLIDFGAALGSASVEEKHSAQGYERRIDWREIGLRLFTLGFRDPEWFRVKRSPYREIGIFEADVFDPSTWAPSYNNPAFGAADADDTLWAASILAHFTRADIDGAVAAAEYREPRAAGWLADALWKRRNKLLRHAFAKRSSLDLPRAVETTLRLTDLVVLAELADTPASYEFTIFWDRTRAADRALGLWKSGKPELDLAPAIAAARADFGRGFADDPYLLVSVRRVIGNERGPPAEIAVRVADDLVLPVALRRR